MKYTLLVVVALYLASLGFGMPVAWPFDCVVNAGPVAVDEALRLPADGKRRVAVLQHGLWRSSWALLRVQRTLEAHGFVVRNLDYPSTMASIEDHAARLRDGVEAVFAEGPVDELSFVGHSLGGLVIEEYLRSAKARQPVACVYIATPHRGAMLCDLRKHWFLFKLAMGNKAALQLSPGDPFHQRPLPLAAIAGTIVGDLGDGNAAILGRDDGTVAVGEAALPGAAATVMLACGHTSIAYSPETARQVLAFLRTRAFAPVAVPR